jgi:hypothetical protein
MGCRKYPLTELKLKPIVGLMFTCQNIKLQLARLQQCSEELRQNEKQRPPAAMEDAGDDQGKALKGRRQKTLHDALLQFWSLVDIKTPQECWEWNGRRFPSGYGRIWFNWRSIRTHRFAFMAANGPIQNGSEICHRCDNPPCCNPSHLFAGTGKDNYADSKQKGRRRSPIGEKHHNSILTEEDVRSIRARYVSTALHRGNATLLAKEYGVTCGAILKITTGKTWKHVP